MQTQTPFQRVLALIVIGIGLIAVGVAAMTLITLRQAPLASGAEKSAIPIQTDYAAPELTLTDMDGKPVSLTDYRGQVVLVNMWATWCPPCVAELPTLNAFYADHAGEGFVIIGLDDGETRDVVVDYVTRVGIDYPIWLDPSYLSERAFNTTNLPSSFLIDRQGTIRLQWVGAISRTALDKYVAPLITK